MTIHFRLKVFQINVISQEHCVVPYKDVTSTAGNDLGRLKLKAKGQCFTLKCQSQFECQIG